MIGVTRLGGEALVVNADLIVTIEPTPDTVVSLMNGDKIVVRETPREVIARVVEYRRLVGGLAADGGAARGDDGVR